MIVILRLVIRLREEGRYVIELVSERRRVLLLWPVISLFTWILLIWLK